jgi:digeranylgeranylglycerophospholipid reductase
MKLIKKVSRSEDLRDTLIVGGGPAGLIAGAEAARSGADVLIIEEDPEIGQPDHCAGLVSKTGLEKIIDPTPAFVLSHIKGARIYAPSGKMYEARSEEVKALVIDRTKFDKELLRRAEANGAEVVTNQIYKPEFQCKVLINAEGTKGRLARRLNFSVPRSIPAAQIDIEVSDFEKDMVELHTGEWAPGFFAWTIPRKDHLRVGLATYEGIPLELIKRMLKKNRNFDMMKGARVLKTIFGRVVVGGPLKRTVQGNAIAVGDAGGFVKPTTGGGVVLGGLTARVAGRVAAEAVLRGKALKDFEGEWRSLYGREFQTMRLAARIFRSMRGGELERALQISSEEGVLSLLTGYDMDLQGAAVSRVLRSRLIRCAILPFLRSLF